MKGLLTFGLLILAICAYAQDSVQQKQPGNSRYFFRIQSGLLIGSQEIHDWCSECHSLKSLDFSAATVHGMTVGRSKRLRVGGGLGIDTYEGWITLPVFASASWDLLRKKNAFFVQVDYGTPLKAWKRTPYDEYGLESYQSAMMFNPAVGYRIHYHDVRLALMMGYKRQVINSYYEYPTYYWDAALGQLVGDPSTMQLKETLNRMMITLSVGWK